MTLSWFIYIVVACMLCREVFLCSVLICFWRVRHAWHKNLMKRCTEVKTRVEVAGRLDEVVQSICKGSGSVDLFDSFMKDFIECSAFLDYFKATWYPRLGKHFFFLVNIST